MDFVSPLVDELVRFGGIILQTNKHRMRGTGCFPTAHWHLSCLTCACRAWHHTLKHGCCQPHSPPVLSLSPIVLVLDPCYHSLTFCPALVFKSDAPPRGQGRNSETSTIRKPDSSCLSAERTKGGGTIAEAQEPGSPSRSWSHRGLPSRWEGHRGDVATDSHAAQGRVYREGPTFWLPSSSCPPISHGCQNVRGQGSTP